MADGDDDDRGGPGPPDSEGGPLESWGELDGGVARSRVRRSWSQLAALDETGRPVSPSPEDKPVEGLLTVDSGLLDMMALEEEGQAADSLETEAGGTTETPPDDGLAGALPDDFDVAGALPDDFDVDDVDESGALPDDIDFDTAIGGLETGLAGLDEPLDADLLDDVALPPDFDFDDDVAIGGALPDEVQLDGIVQEDASLDAALFESPPDTASGAALPDAFDLPDDGDLAGLLGAEDGALPDDIELDGGALPDDLGMPDDLPLDDLPLDDLPLDDLPLDDLGGGALPDDLDDGALPPDFDFDGVIGADDPDASMATAPGEMVPDGIDLPDDFDDLDAVGAVGGAALPAELLDDDLAMDLIGDGTAEPTINPDDLAIELDADLDLDDEFDEFDDLEVGGDLAIGGAADDWLDGVLDKVDADAIADEGWGELLDDVDPVADLAPIALEEATIDAETAAAPADPAEDLWAAADWGDEPEVPSQPASMPFVDPFAVPADGGLQDETGFLGDPFARISEGEPTRRRRTGVLPPLTGETEVVDPDDEASGERAARTVVDDSSIDDRPIPPSPDDIAAALALLARRTSARRRDRVVDADDPEVMVVEELLQDSDERRVVRIEYPRLGEMEILELPEDGALLPGLDEEFDAPFGEEFVFFGEDALGAESQVGARRSALAALSREPVELARLLAGTPSPRADSESDDAPISSSPSSSASAEIAVALDALEIEPLGAALAVPSDGGPLAVPRPSWVGAEAQIDEDAIARMGVPFLGVIPPFGARPVSGAFPVGSLARRPRVDAPGQHAVLPALVVPEGESTWADRLLRFLVGEARAEADRRRLAVLLHGVGVIARSPLGHEALALTALRAATENDPELVLSRWSLLALLEESEHTEDAVDWLLTPTADGGVSGDRRHWAGHLIRSALRDGPRAQALWDAASTAEAPHLPSLLARYLSAVPEGDPAAIGATIDRLLDTVENPSWWTALAIERVRLGADAHPGTRPTVLLEDAIRRRGGVPAVFAAAETHALATGDMSLWLSALRARFEKVMGAYEDGGLDESVAQREVAEVFVKAGLALETLGRRTEALAEYENALGSFPDDPYVLHRAVELARRLGDHDALRRHLDRIARLSPSADERAEAAYQMGLAAQRVLADDAAAEQDYERALDALPTFTPALSALGRLDLRRGRLDAIQDRYADEIRQREDALRQPQIAAERRRTIVELVDRYYRLARLLEETGDAPVALDVYKRALAVDPTFLPAFEAMDRLYTRHGRWRERAALIMGWVQRQGGTPLDAVGPLLTAADVLRVHLGDDPNAARLAARTLALSPDHPYALRRASESFARIGNTAARIEVDLRWGRSDADPRAPSRLLRAAQLQELDGDSLAAAAEALPLYRESLARDPDAVAAVDGLVRTALRLGRTGELVQQIELHDLAAQRAPTIAIPIAEALLSAGRPDEAAEFLIRWRARARVAGTLDRRADAASLSLLALACERTDHWRALADALEEQAALTTGPSRAALLARVGALWELRLGDTRLASDAYRRAIEADSTCRSAEAGVERLSVAERGDWRPDGPQADALARARQADRSGDIAGRIEALDAVADHADDPRQVVAWRVLARGEDTNAEAAGALFAAHPERADLFGSYRRRLEEAGDTERLVEALWLRLDYEDEPGRTALLTSIIGHGMRSGDHATVYEAADALLEMDPRSLPALLARRRLARLSGDPKAGSEAGRRLSTTLRAPRPAAELHHAEAIEAESRGAPPRQVQALLDRAVTLDPSHDAAAEALAGRLKSAGDWQGLDRLYQRRLAAVADPPLRRRIAGARAELRAARFDDTAGAYALLEQELLAEATDPETALLAAGFAEALGRTADADRCYGLAATAEGGRLGLEATRAYATTLHRRGDTQRARQMLERIVAARPRDVDALELLAEVLASERDWKQVVQVFRNLIGLETSPTGRADRAMAIGEIFSRVYKDGRRAAGWFKRAVEFDPARLRALWRLLEEAEKAPEASVPVEHVEDAIDRAVDAQRQALVDRPANRESLDALARLHARRGDRDAQLLVGEALAWLGFADQRTRSWIRAARARVSLDFARPLSDELRTGLLDHPDEHDRSRTVFDAFALVLTEVLSGALPPGVPRLSRRSFPEWQAEFRRLAGGLAVDDVELFNGGRALTRPRGVYLPRPSIAVPAADLEAAIDARQAFALGDLLEGLRGGRLLLEAPGVGRVALCASVMASVLCPGLLPSTPVDAVPERLRQRLVERAKRLPRRLKLQLDALAADGGAPVDLTRLARAVATTRARAGLVCCGDLQVALDALVFPDAAAANGARRAGGTPAALDASPAGQRLLAYALGSDHGRLRRVLGLGLSGRRA